MTYGDYRDDVDVRDVPLDVEASSAGRWTVEQRTGSHDDGRPWRVFYVADQGVTAFSSPGLDLALAGIRDTERTEADRLVAA